jgi:prepilin signal peptidase PulO-like enzyme (type II secretory pathway)
MKLTILILIVLIGGVISKLCAIYISYVLNLKDFAEIKKNKRFIFFPWFLLSLNRKRFFKKGWFPYIFIEIYGFVLGGLFLLSMDNYFKKYQSNLGQYYFLLLAFTIIFISLLFLSVFDILTLSIPTQVVKYLYLFVVFINLMVAVGRFISLRTGVKHIPFENIPLGNFDNLLMALFLSFIVWVLSSFTNESAMGRGDIDIAGIMGIMLGWPNVISGIMYTLYVGGIIGVVYWIVFKKFKNTLVPFVPVITLGFVLALGFSDYLINLFLYGKV